MITSDHEFTNLGAIHKPDPRDIQLGKVQLPITIPDVFLPDISTMPRYYQGKTPTCGAHGGAWLQNYLKNITPELSRRFLWDEIKLIDGLPVESGTTMQSIFKTLRDKGIPELPDNLIDQNVNDVVYTDPSWITPEVIAKANQNTINSFAFVNDLSFNGLKQAIYQNKAVVCSVQVGKEWWQSKQGNISWKEADVLPVRIPATVISGHFVVLYGYEAKRIYFMNSWSERWGQNGIGYFEEVYMPYVVNAGTVIDLPDYVVINLTQQISLLQKVVFLLKMLLKGRKTF